MHRQCSHFFYSPLFILEDKPLHTLMTKNTYILLFNTPTHLCLYHNINPPHTLMTRVKARHFTASTNNLAQRLSIYIHIYIHTHIYILFFFFSVSNLILIVRGLPREIIQLLPSQRKKPKLFNPARKTYNN